jgi:pre-mRNA-splicing factor ISY1
MARNAEKSNLMLNKWTAMVRGDAGPQQRERRPYLASECKSLPEAERWRRDIIRDVTRRMADVQNAGLGAARLRDLNDEINKLLREKSHWERQIRALGGPDHAASAPRLEGAEAGFELPGARGYKYFGAARELPGVKELFADAAAAASAGAADFAGFGGRRRGDVVRGLTPDYFGFRDEDDGVLLPLEARRSAELRAQLHAQWLADGGEEGARKRLRLAGGSGAGAGAGAGAGSASGGADGVFAGAAAAGGAAAGGAAGSGAADSAGTSAITLNDAEAMIAARRRQMLAERYESAQSALEGGAGIVVDDDRG